MCTVVFAQCRLKCCGSAFEETQVSHSTQWAGVDGSVMELPGRKHKCEFLHDCKTLHPTRLLSTVCLSVCPEAELLT
jgi:hypothetical protein